jgi:hypothetical protein
MPLIEPTILLAPSLTAASRPEQVQSDGSSLLAAFRKPSRTVVIPLRPSSLSLRSPEPHARASAILADEFDASGLKCKSYYFKSCSTRVAHSGFDLTDSHNANSGSIGNDSPRPPWRTFADSLNSHSLIVRWSASAGARRGCQGTLRCRGPASRSGWHN